MCDMVNGAAVDVLVDQPQSWAVIQWRRFLHSMRDPCMYSKSNSVVIGTGKGTGKGNHIFTCTLGKTLRARSHEIFVWSYLPFRSSPILSLLDKTLLQGSDESCQDKLKPSSSG